MAWVRFVRDYDFSPSAEYRVTIAYLAGGKYPVTSECRDFALMHGVAVEIPTPRREAAAQLKADPHWRADAKRT